MTTPPNELTGHCVGNDGVPTTHRIWITPRGRVITPDHGDGYDHEHVVTALGGAVDHLCARWHTAAAMRHNRAARLPLFPSGDIPSWRYTQQHVWTGLSIQVANTALLGELVYRPLPPADALTLTQTYLEHDAPMPHAKAWAETLYLFTHPTEREMGWRRSTPAPATTVAALLDTGVDPSIVADLAALDVPVAVVATAVPVLRKYRLPGAVLLSMAVRWQPDELRQRLAAVTQATVHQLAAELQTDPND